MNKEEISKLFEAAALGCLDSAEYKIFIQLISEDEELKSEFGKYQKAASLIPFSLDLELPPADVKNKVVIGIKNIILSRMQENKSMSKQSEEKIIETAVEANLKENTDDKFAIENKINENISDNPINSENIYSEFENPIVENLSDDSLNFNSENGITPNAVKSESEQKAIFLNEDFNSKLKEEIIEEITKKTKKTINYHFEELENKINKKNKSTNIFLILITLLLLLILGWNAYLFLYPVEKKVEIKKEIKTPLINSADSLIN
jgi:hypothetical protein